MSAAVADAASDRVTLKRIENGLRMVTVPLPHLGGLISGRRAAYEYLPSSVAAFHSRQALSTLLEGAGLTDVRVTDLAFGAVVIHRGVKPGVAQ